MAWAPDYVTLQEFKDFLRISDTTDDVEYAAVITAASRAVDQCCSRQFGKVATTETRYYDGVYDWRHREWSIEFDDLQDTTGFLLSTSDKDVTDVIFTPRNAVSKGLVYTGLVFGDSAEAFPSTGVPLVSIEAEWGWTSIPVAVAEATKIQANRFLSRRDSPSGVLGSPNQETEIRLSARVDVDVQVMLSKYRRRWAVV